MQIFNCNRGNVYHLVFFDGSYQWEFIPDIDFSPMENPGAVIYDIYLMNRKGTMSKNGKTYRAFFEEDLEPKKLLHEHS